MAVLSFSAAASPKKKLSAIDIQVLCAAVVAIQLADSVIKAIDPDDVKTDRLEIAKALAPIVKGVIG